MSDPRVAKLGDLLVNYALELQPGQIVRIDASTVAAPLVTEIYRYALRAGASTITRSNNADAAPWRRNGGAMTKHATPITERGSTPPTSTSWNRP